MTLSTVRLVFVLAGVLMYLSVPPAGLGFLAFAALIPFAHAASQAPGYRAAAFGGFLAGAAFYIPALVWLTPVTYAGWMALSLYCAAYLSAFAVFVRWCARRGSLQWAILPAACWVLLEYVRGAVAFTGFPWILYSHTQYAFTTFTQVLDVVGAYGLSGILVAINFLLYRAARKPARHLVPAAAIVAAICVYGYVRMHSLEIEPSLRVAMVQASIPQEMKLAQKGSYDPKGVLDRYLETSGGIPEDSPIDLIVWPETVVLSPLTLNVVPDVLNDEVVEDTRFAQQSLAALARKHGAFILAGATSFLPAEYGYVSSLELARQIPRGIWTKRYNSAYLLDREGKYLDRYDKMHLVPFGEYIPLPNLLPFLKYLVPFEASLNPGTRQTVFEIQTPSGNARFGVLICYEDTDAQLARTLRKQEVDFLVNISNDAWFGLSELDQHFIAARYRAIENRVGVVRSGNNGITSVIDPLGVPGPALEKNAIAASVGAVSTTGSRSVYTAAGDWPALLASILALALMPYAGRTRRSK